MKSRAVIGIIALVALSLVPAAATGGKLAGTIGPSVSWYVPDGEADSEPVIGLGGGALYQAGHFLVGGDYAKNQSGDQDLASLTLAWVFEPTERKAINGENGLRFVLGAGYVTRIVNEDPQAGVALQSGIYLPLAEGNAVAFLGRYSWFEKEQYPRTLSLSTSLVFPWSGILGVK